MQPTMFCDQSTTLIKDPETFDYTEESKKKKKDEKWLKNRYNKDMNELHLVGVNSI